MPPEVRELRGQWPSQVERVPFLTAELEKDFRFGQRISKTERGYYMGGTIKGGTSSVWYPSSREEYDAYHQWRKLEGLHEARDEKALMRLLGILQPNGIELVTRRHGNASRAEAKPYEGFGPLYSTCADVLVALPVSHLSRPELKRIHLGGWGPDSAKASAYTRGTDGTGGSVLMYDFAIRGARRTFVGLFLHELGHAHESALSQDERQKLERAYDVIRDADAFMGIEFLLERSARKLHQKFSLNEFLAETYLIYTACGTALRAFIAEQEEKVRTAWESVYEVFRATFLGIEYE
ncbi:hypothetical protein HY251_14765 [bacterium]|nr:hypothetical protein [bacterium]